MGFLNKEFASSPPSDKHPRQKRKARVEGRGGEIRERTATTVERAASQFNHGDNRNNGFAYHRIYPLRLYIAALRGGALKRTARVQCRANTRDGSTVSLQNDRQDFLQIPCHVLAATSLPLCIPLFIGSSAFHVQHFRLSLHLDKSQKDITIPR